MLKIRKVERSISRFEYDPLRVLRTAYGVRCSHFVPVARGKVSGGEGGSDGTAQMHAKTLVCDGKILLIGSSESLSS